MELVEGKEYWIKAKFLRDDNYHLKPLLFEFREGVDGASWTERNIEAVEAIPEREKVVIPKFVADWIEACKRDGDTLAFVLEGDYDVAEWLETEGDEELLARAYLDGYEIEKEPLYWVRDKGDNPILFKWPDGNISSSSTAIDKASQRENKEFYALTEQEIKDYDERYWAFAVSVEEVEEC